MYLSHVWDKDKVSEVLMLPDCYEIKSIESDHFAASPLNYSQCELGNVLEKMTPILLQKILGKGSHFGKQSCLF